MKFSIKNYIKEHNNILSKINEQEIEKIVSIIFSVYMNGKKIITCGNGGSASTASHMITDWNKMTTMATGKKLYGFSLTDNIGLITAYANDTNYENVFKGQLESIMDKGDCLVAISGSGQSKNVINVGICWSNWWFNSSILGFDVTPKYHKNLAVVPSNDMQICEDVHLMICHIYEKTL